jgi:Flp pilus assembly protein TadG
MVEFSLITVLLVMVLVGIVEMSRMVLAYTAISNAARAGARYAIVHGADRPTTGVNAVDQQSPASCAPSSCTQIQTVVQNYASAGLINGNNVTVTVSFPSSNNAVGSHVQVTATYTYDPLIGYFATVLNKTLSSTSEGVIVF